MVCDVHPVPGRIRFKIPGLRNDDILICALPRALRAYDGVDRVEVRPASNSLIVHYDPIRLDCQALARSINHGVSATSARRGASGNGNGAAARAALDRQQPMRAEDIVIDSVRHMGIVFGRTAFKVALEQAVRGGLSTPFRATAGRS